MTDLVSQFISRYGRLPTERDPDYLEMLAMSKYRFLTVPDFKPGKCANCGSSKEDGRRYVDFGVEIDWYGTIYLCGFCLKDVAEKMGLFKDLEDRLETVKAELLKIDRLQQQGDALDDKLTSIFTAVKEYHDRCNAIRNNPDSNSTASVGTNQEQSDKSGTDQTESRTSESSSSAGREDVPSFRELLERNT